MKKKLTTLKGLLTISRPSGGEKERIEISIEDESSRVQFFDGSLTLEDFAKALTGHACVPVVFELRRPDLIGAKAENKTELVPFQPHAHFEERQKYRSKDDHDARTPSVNAALKPFEVDGWSARVSDMWNGHCSRAGFQRVTFFRHVKDGKPIDP